MNLLSVLQGINIGILVVFAVCYIHQYFYLILGLFKKPKEYSGTKMHRYAVMVAARNEQDVIVNLINSIDAQTYPKELIDIYVIADNCTDDTAKVAKNAGAVVFERFNTEFVGKGYAMNMLFNEVTNLKGKEYYDGYFIFDADNLLDKHFVEEMNKGFGGEYKALTCYRNSKNIGDNWISYGYGIWFLREARYLNHPRCAIGTSCAVSGTGFLFHRDVINRNDGWNFFLFTEDIEFTIDMIVHGEKIGYCHKAIIYDEQPTTFAQSWTQRIRWVKGYFQVFGKYGKQLVKGIFSGKSKFSFFDMTMNNLPAFFLTIIGLVANIGFFVASILTGNFSIDLLLSFAASLLGGSYFLMLMLAALVLITEWKSIRCSNAKKILYLFTFPIYMLTYVPVAIAAIFKKVEWKPIKHSVSMNIEDIEK